MFSKYKSPGETKFEPIRGFQKYTVATFNLL